MCADSQVSAIVQKNTVVVGAAHSSGSHGAVSSVKLRHFSGKLWGDIHGSPGTQHSVSNQARKKMGLRRTLTVRQNAVRTTSRTAHTPKREQLEDRVPREAHVIISDR
jgi:hypothetical protein